jgi:RNA polymerase sigma factor (sigma-70 family)
MDDGICLIELSEDFRQALMALTELQRRYFVMNRLEGYSYAEIARMDGKTEAAIRKHVRLAIPLLKNFLA